MFGLTFTTQNIGDFFAPFKTCSWKQAEFIDRVNGPGVQEDKLDKTKEYLRVDSSCVLEDTYSRRACADKNTTYYPMTPKIREDLYNATTNCLFWRRDLMPNEISISDNNCRFEASIVQWNHKSQSWGHRNPEYNTNFVRN